MTFIQELKWRRMIHDFIPGLEDQLSKELTTAYVGIDPTADSLHIGNLVQIMTMMHFQRHGHKPILLVGGATGMVGDPSGKDSERKLLSEEDILNNIKGIKKQLLRFLDFDSKKNSAEIMNNIDWFKNFSFLYFIRDVGKHITINYMMTKDSVKSRLETGMSFTEFTYQLVQGYDFYYLFKNKNCKVQLGGSDQWGNIVTGTELIRRKESGAAYALTTPLIEKSDGSKFGKSDEGNIWLDENKTSVFKFYQFWLNTSDEDAEKYLKIFTLLDQKQISDIMKEQVKSPHYRVAQKKLAQQVTCLVHSEEKFQLALQASDILFGKSTYKDVAGLSEKDFLNVFEGVPTYEVSEDVIYHSDMIDLLSSYAAIFNSKSEVRRMLESNSVSLNKEKITVDKKIENKDLLNNKYLLIQKGKKNYFIIIVK